MMDPRPCYRQGGCGPYENRSCSECPASKSEYAERYKKENTKMQAKLVIDGKEFPMVDYSIYKCHDPSKPLKKIHIYDRTFLLQRGDVFCVNEKGVKESLGIKIKDIKLSTQHIWPNIICIEKIKRKWWQFWKPKYVAAKFMCVKDN